MTSDAKGCPENNDLTQDDIDRWAILFFCLINVTASVLAAECCARHPEICSDSVFGLWINLTALFTIASAAFLLLETISAVQKTFIYSGYVFLGFLSFGALMASYECFTQYMEAIVVLRHWFLISSVCQTSVGGIRLIQKGLLQF